VLHCYQVCISSFSQGNGPKYIGAMTLSFLVHMTSSVTWPFNSPYAISYKEIVFHISARPALSCPLVGIERVASAEHLGGTFSQTLSFAKHVHNILTNCNQHLYLLKWLKSQGHPLKHLRAVFSAIILTRILYFSMLFLLEEVFSHLVGKIDLFLQKVVGYEYVTRCCYKSFTDIFTETDRILFKRVLNFNA